MEFKKYYDDYKPTITTIEGDSQTMQEFSDECDINRILKRYSETGLLPNCTNTDVTYGDVSGIHGLFDIFQHLETANKAFESIPSEIRLQFGNDPLKFEQWIYDNPGMAERYGYLINNNNNDLTMMKNNNDMAVGVEAVQDIENK